MKFQFNPPKNHVIGNLNLSDSIILTYSWAEENGEPFTTPEIRLMLETFIQVDMPFKECCNGIQRDSKLTDLLHSLLYFHHHLLKPLETIKLMKTSSPISAVSTGMSRAGALAFPMGPAVFIHLKLPPQIFAQTGLGPELQEPNLYFWDFVSALEVSEPLPLSLLFWATL